MRPITKGSVKERSGSMTRQMTEPNCARVQHRREAKCAEEKRSTMDRSTIALIVAVIALVLILVVIF